MTGAAHVTRCAATAYLGRDSAPPAGSLCRCDVGAACDMRTHECVCGSRWTDGTFGPDKVRLPPPYSLHGAPRDPMDRDPLLDRDDHRLFGDEPHDPDYA